MCSYKYMPLIIRNHRGQYSDGVSIPDEIIHLLFPNKPDVRVSPQNFKNIRESLYKLSDDCLRFSRSRSHSIFMGGDHSTSFGTVLSSLRKYGNNFRLIWIDAHTDIHSFESSPSLNLHGMVVRMLMEHAYTDIPQLKPEQLLFIGTRSSEIPELEFIRRKDIQVISMRQINTNPRECFERIAHFVHNQNVHISLDVDVLDPSVMSSTGTREPDGLQIDELLAFINCVRYHCRSHFATDIMEFNPKLGNRRISIKTLKKIIDYLGNN
jgi:arginase